MKTKLLCLGIFVFLFLPFNYAQTNLLNINDAISYNNCDNCWNRDSLGNHRAVVQVVDNSNWVKLILPWRRRDNDPQNKRIIIQDAQTKSNILDFKIISINREWAEIHFKPITGKGLYYIYYMPYKNEGRSNYPKGVYLKPIENNIPDVPTNGVAKVVSFESIDALNSFYPMEIIATKDEKIKFIENASSLNNQSIPAFIVIPEDRAYPIKMKDDLPLRWMQKDLTNFEASADKGEWYAFQLGVYSLIAAHHIQVEFSDLISTNGAVIKASAISCINTDGVSYEGTPFKKVVDIDSNKIQALWCGIDIPVSAKAGIYQGKIKVKSKEFSSKEINFTLKISQQIAINNGTEKPWNQSRLKWLNSTMAQKNEVIKPYTPLLVKGKEIKLLGRKLILKSDGLPAQIQTFYNTEMTDYVTQPKNILIKPMQFILKATPIEKTASKTNFSYKKIEQGIVQWTATTQMKSLEMQVNGSIEFDGFMVYKVKITALQDVSFQDIQMQIPFTKSSSKYMMGLGQKGGIRPSQFDWVWEVATKNQDGAWMGDVNAGIQFSLRDENYVRPLNTNFYLQKPLHLPVSWGNNNKGGIHITENKDTVLVNNYSGSRELKKGESVHYDFTILITPFHTINTDFQWGAKFYHAYKPIDTIKENTSATIVNIHHANEINPWINYPFIEYGKMKSYIDEAHRKGLKVKIYNTIRELSNHAYETFPLRSLGNEIYSSGKGGGYSWLQEHLGDDYIAAWFVPNIKDAAIVNSGMSRWHNYYIEGLNWLVKNVGIDGLYLDDVAFDRVTMKRAKRILTQGNHPGIIDLHSANQFNKNDGFNNSANLYMEHFPYLNKLWFGEYFDYQNSSADFYLTEVSGIPFGLMGEMLQDGGNPYRGLVYGMTNRMPWSEKADPRSIWKLWDDFGIKGSKMIGYWSEHCPVSTSDPKVLATVYKKSTSALVSIASWADSARAVDIKIDFKKLGFDPQRCTVNFPSIANFQSIDASTINKNLLNKGIIPSIFIDKAKGLVLIINEK